jgi:hypothetical protein
MKRTLHLARAAVLAAAVTAALGFGASQAMAGTTAATRARACDTMSCTTYCQSIYGSDAIGRCTTTGTCRCLF